MNATTPAALIDQDKFLDLLLAGLRYQDPMQPVDNNQFLGQLTQFANLQAMQNLNANFDQLLRLQQLTQGANLLGKTVHYVIQGELAAGLVRGVSVENGKVLLDVGSNRIALDAVRSLRD
jgi:flagellar basal-body rod modification protein FlgD